MDGMGEMSDLGCCLPSPWLCSSRDPFALGANQGARHLGCNYMRTVDGTTNRGPGGEARPTRAPEGCARACVVSRGLSAEHDLFVGGYRACVEGIELVLAVSPIGKSRASGQMQVHSCRRHPSSKGELSGIQTVASLRLAIPMASPYTDALDGIGPSSKLEAQRRFRLFACAVCGSRGWICPWAALRPFVWCPTQAPRTAMPRTVRVLVGLGLSAAKSLQRLHAVGLGLAPRWLAGPAEASGARHLNPNCPVSELPAIGEPPHNPPEPQHRNQLCVCGEPHSVAAGLHNAVSFLSVGALPEFGCPCVFVWPADSASFI